VAVVTPPVVSWESAFTPPTNRLLVASFGTLKCPAYLMREIVYCLP